MSRMLARSAMLVGLVFAVGCDDSPSGPSTSSAIEITPGVPVTGLSGGVHSRKLYRIVVPAGTPILTVETNGGSGDVDVLVRRERVPTFTNADCDSYNEGNTDGCSISPVAAGTYYILLYGSDEDEGYSGVTLIATFAPHA
jgi:hypothetical protein